MITKTLQFWPCRYGVFVLLLMQMSIATQAQCVSDTVKATCGNTQIWFETQRYDTVGIALVHVHENETTALQSALWLIDSIKQGSVTTWHSQQQRLVDFSIGSGNFRFDPNRIYTKAGLHSALMTDITDTIFATIKAVADTFLQHFIMGKSRVVAVHSNTDKGGLSVNSYAKGGAYFRDAKAVYSNPMLDADDFFYTTEEKYFRYLKSRRYNVVLQNNERVTDDGSLSVYCARQGIGYINVEAQNEHLQQQQNMLGIIWEMLKTEHLNTYTPTGN